MVEKYEHYSYRNGIRKKDKTIIITPKMGKTYFMVLLIELVIEIGIIWYIAKYHPKLFWDFWKFLLHMGEFVKVLFQNWFSFAL